MKPRTFLAVFFAMVCVGAGVLWIVIGNSNHNQKVANARALAVAQTQSQKSLQRGLLIVRNRALVECKRGNVSQFALRDLALHEKNFGKVLDKFLQGAIRRAKSTEKVQKGVELKATRQAISFYTTVDETLDTKPKIPPIPKSCQKEVPTVAELLASVALNPPGASNK